MSGKRPDFRIPAGFPIFQCLIVRLQPVVRPPTIGLRAKNLENRTINASLTCVHFLSWTRRRARRPHAEEKLVDQLISTTTLRFFGRRLLARWEQRHRTISRAMKVRYFPPEGARTTHYRLACYVRATCEQPAPSKVIVRQSHDGPTCLRPLCALYKGCGEKRSFISELTLVPSTIPDFLFFCLSTGFFLLCLPKAEECVLVVCSQESKNRRTFFTEVMSHRASVK